MIIVFIQLKTSMATFRWVQTYHCLVAILGWVNSVNVVQLQPEFAFFGLNFSLIYLCLSKCCLQIQNNFQFHLFAWMERRPSDSTNFWCFKYIFTIFNGIRWRAKDLCSSWLVAKVPSLPKIHFLSFFEAEETVNSGFAHNIFEFSQFPLDLLLFCPRWQFSRFITSYPAPADDNSAVPYDLRFLPLQILIFSHFAASQKWWSEKIPRLSLTLHASIGITYDSYHAFPTESL